MTKRVRFTIDPSKTDEEIAQAIMAIVREHSRDAKESAPRWSDAFSRSSFSPVVFNVKKPFRSALLQVIKDQGLVRVSWQHVEGSPVSSGWFRGAATAVLDGMVLELTSRWGIPQFDDLNTGVRVLGTRPLRLFCELLGLTPPSRLLIGEDTVPLVADLLSELAEQLTAPEKDLAFVGEKGRGISEVSALQKLVIDLFGEAAVPNMSTALKAILPGTGDWGRNGFSLLDQEKLIADRVSIEEARRWKHLGLGHWNEIQRARYVSVDEFRDYLEAGFPLTSVFELAQSRVPLPVANAYLATGLNPHAIVSLLTNGYTVDAAAALVREGIFERPGWRAAIEARRE